MRVDFNLTLRGKMQPYDRGELEEALEDALDGTGFISGGGALKDAEGRIECSDISVSFDLDAVGDPRSELMKALEDLRIPEGSLLVQYKPAEDIDENQQPVDDAPDDLIEASWNVGNQDILELGFDNAILDEKGTESRNLNDVVEEIVELLGEDGEYFSSEDASGVSWLYLIGDSYEVMKNLLAPYLEKEPLCEGCVVRQNTACVNS